MMTTWKHSMLVASIIFIAVVAATTPQVNFPLGSQFPPVARVGNPYSFQFASTTFHSDDDKLQYSLIGHPPWLSLNAQNRTLTGTPRAEDVGTATFTITAAGEAGAVVNMESKLLVTNSAAPTTNVNVSQVLSSVGQLSRPKSVILLPSKPFDITFPLDTFRARGDEISFFATLADRTPLPAWISFDALSLHFAGTTPPVTSSPQSFNITLIAADTHGYTEASVSFSLDVTNHQLLFRPLQQNINITKGDPVNVSGLLKQLSLDNVSVSAGDIQSAIAELPSWLSFDNSTFDITGLPPAGLMSQELRVIVKDKFGDTAQQSIHLLFKSALFGEEVGSLDITRGRPFEHKFLDSVLSDKNSRLTINFGPLGPWLKFDATTFTISGMIPEDFAGQDIQCTMIATSGDGKLKDSQDFQFHISGSSVPPTDSTHSGISDNGSNGLALNHNSKSNKASVIAGSVVGGLCASAIVIALVVLVCRRRVKSRGYFSPKSPQSPRKADISRPIMIQEEWERTNGDTDLDLEKGEGDGSPLSRTPENPPQLPRLALKRKDSHSLASSIGERDSHILNSFEDSPWDFKVEAGPSHQPHDSMKIPTAIARRESDTLGAPIKYCHQAAAVQRDSHRSSGLPVNRRLTGIGHGRHRSSLSRSNSVLTSFRRPLTRSSYTTDTKCSLLTDSSVFPQPPAARHTTQVITPFQQRQSIRLVTSSSIGTVARNGQRRRTLEKKKRFSEGSRASSVGGRPIDEERQSWIRKRASAQSPFFGASGSRVSSSNYRNPPAFINEMNTPKLRASSPPTTRETTRTSGNVDNSRIRRPSDTPSVEERTTVSGSLRRPVTPRSFTNRSTIDPTGVGDQVKKCYERPGITMGPGSNISRCASAGQSLQAYKLKSSLNDLTDSKIFEDAELSGSVYSEEEEDIQEYERRTAIQLNQPSLLPLDISPFRISKENSEKEAERDSETDNDKETERLSQSGPTPFSLALDYGGKENQPPRLSPVLPSNAKGKAKASNTSKSPERPITTIGIRLVPHSRSESKARARRSQNRPLSRQPSYTSRYSKAYTRSESRRSTSKLTQDDSRPQSSSYPHLNAALPTQTQSDRNKANKENVNSTWSQRHTTGPTVSRRVSSNLVNEDFWDDPIIEEQAPSSSHVRPAEGRVYSSSRRSRLAQPPSYQYLESRYSNQNRETKIGPGFLSNNPYARSQDVELDERTEETPSPAARMSRNRDRERTPLSVLDDGNGATPKSERVRIVEGKERRPISAEVDSELKLGASQRGRKTWGSLRGFWERERDNDSKVFL